MNNALQLGYFHFLGNHSLSNFEIIWKSMEKLADSFQKLKGMFWVVRIKK